MSNTVTVRLEGELEINLDDMSISSGGVNLSAFGDRDCVEGYAGGADKISVDLSSRVALYFDEQAQDLERARIEAINADLKEKADEAEEDESLYKDGADVLLNVIEVLSYLDNLDKSMHASVPNELFGAMASITDYIEKNVTGKVSS